MLHSRRQFRLPLAKGFPLSLILVLELDNVQLRTFIQGMRVALRNQKTSKTGLSRLPGYAQLVPGASKLRTETRKTQTEEGNSKAVEDTTQHEC